MIGITEAREATQPVKSRTGGLDFQNSARSQGLALIDAGRLPRTPMGGRASFGAAWQLRSQSRQRERGPRSKRWAKRCGSAEKQSGIHPEWEIKRIVALLERGRGN